MKPLTTRVGKFLGLRGNTDAERMTAGDLIEAINVRIDGTGRAARRPGRTALSAGATHSLWSEGDAAFGVVSGALVRIAPNLSMAPLVPGMANQAVNYCRLDSRTYWSNGVTAGCIDGANRPWGLPVPQLVQATRIGGGLPAGRYQYALTALAADGQESGASASNVLELPDSSGVQVMAPADAAGDVILYLSKPGGSTLFKAVMGAPGTALAYTGAGMDLMSPLLTQFMQPAPPSNAIALHAGRLWLGVADSVLPSAAFSPELFDYRAEIPVEGTVGMLIPVEGAGLVVGTDKAIQFLAGNDPAEMSISTRLNEACIPGAFTSVPGALFGDGSIAKDVTVFATVKGLYAALPDGSIASLTHERYPLSLAGRGAAYFDADLRTVVLSAA